MTEDKIVHEAGNYFVYEAASSYDVMRNVGTHSETVHGAVYAKSEDGKPIAIAYCDYLASK